MTTDRKRGRGKGRPDVTSAVDVPFPSASLTAPADAHEWVSFEDPHEERTWVFDVTFLLSHWGCIFGAGCQGVLTGPAADLAQGCCSYGAHFTDERDVERVRSAARGLTPEQWQYHGVARRGGIARAQSDGTRITRLVDGACIFLNRPGFPGGAGCALHRAALERDQLPLELKPDVCWQLPLRREDVVGADGHVTSTVSEWDRRHWGEGGNEFHWWCTEAPEAFRAEHAVYRHMAAELVALVGPVVYELARSYLETRETTVALPHPTVRSVSAQADSESR